MGTLLTAMVEEPGLLVSGTRRIHPLLLVAIPLGALIFTTRWQLYRTAAATPMARLGWAALVALPFALLMLVFARHRRGQRHDVDSPRRRAARSRSACCGARSAG